MSNTASGSIATKRRKSAGIPLSASMLLITLGVVYGDIGTSPMYVMKSIVAGNGGLSSVTEELILGALSLVIWTLTLVTTVKYVLVAMKADNHNEGGIFALYSLVRKCGKGLIIPAMIGGAALLADGVLTPAVTVTTAIEGLRSTTFGYALIGDDQSKVVAITIAIICVLFLAQRAGTSSIGKAFGPIMTLWFLFLGVAGVINFAGNPGILRALNPIRGLEFLFSPNNHAGWGIMAFVFLCTTGAEALYSDMGHVGKSNIYVSWPFVKLCLILNYLGQGAWLLANSGNADLLALDGLNPFYQMLPAGMRPFAIFLSAVAAIIASQALITGSFTLVSEAIRLDLMPHLQTTYPSQTKGQLYIPLVNTIMWIGTVAIVLFFQTSERMEAAYGLAITVTMLMTTTLLVSYIACVRKNKPAAVLFALVFGAIEMSFFLSCCTLFFRGGYVMIILAGALFYVMYVWRRGTAIERTQSVYLPVEKYVDQIAALSCDESYPLLADNLVFLTNDSSLDKLDRDILYSILDKRPKRARAYYFLNVQVTDEPFTHEFMINDFGTDYLFKVQLRLGFKVNQRINTYLYQVVANLIASRQLTPQDHKYSIYREHSQVGDFRFCMLRKTLSPETDISGADRTVMESKYFIRRFCGSPVRWYGIENSDVIFEHVPLFSKTKRQHKLTRVAVAMGATGASSAAKTDEVEEDIFSTSVKDDLAESIKEVAHHVLGGDTASFRPLVLDGEEDEEDGE